LSQILHKLEDRDAGLERLYDMDEKEIGALIRHPNGGKVIHLMPSTEI
jgi:activating signal cointegrator complex subunit 3